MASPLLLQPTPGEYARSEDGPRRTLTFVRLWEAFGLDQTATVFLQTAIMFFKRRFHFWTLVNWWPLSQHELFRQTGICTHGHLRSEGDASVTRGDWLAPPPINPNCPDSCIPDTPSALSNVFEAFFSAESWA